ncbi:MAG: DUF1127 domain-containing protein [Rhodobacteraceae bacterium]|nr:DUF1127 domain-containing protein [Paracoccaceae bacterium]
MAYAATTSSPMGAVATLRVVDSILNLKNTVISWNNARVTRNVLSRLTDDQLNDIGLNRGDLI